MNTVERHAQAYRNFKDAGFTIQQAEVVMKYVESEQLVGIKDLVTKQDLKDSNALITQDIHDARSEVKKDIHDLRSEVKDVRFELKSDIQEIRSELGQFKVQMKYSTIILAILMIVTPYLPSLFSFLKTLF